MSDIGRKSAATEAESALRAHLERSLRTRFEANPCKPHCWFYYGSYDFVLREGRFFTPDARFEDTRGANSGHSLLSSPKNAVVKRLSYIEGYAMNESSPIPVLHAWNSNDDGFVVDAAWHPPGIAYFGVVIPYVLVSAARDQEPSIGSLIDNWRQQWPLLRRPWSKILAESAIPPTTI